MQLPTTRLFVLLAAVLLQPAASAALRAQSQALTPVNMVDKAELNRIHEKWDKMDQFMEIMFTISCDWKHGKDMHGLYSHKLAEGELGANDYEAFMKQSQAESVTRLKESCGLIVAKGEKNCRQGCQDRYGKWMGKRDACDTKCETAYGNFEHLCTSKAGNLEMVFDTKQGKAAASKQCYEGYCKEYPSVWIMEDETAMNTEVQTRCDSHCSADAIRTRCEQLWSLEIDFRQANITTTCFGMGSVGTCYNAKKGPADTWHGTCVSDGEGTCDAQHTNCTAEGETDANFKEGKEFCDKRQHMCKKQTTAHCLKNYTSVLNDARAECEATGEAEMKTCEATQLTLQENALMSNCTATRTPLCQSDCKHNRCNVMNMTSCLGNLPSTTNLTKEFCTDFWGLLHSSSEVDPMTGDPIVLLGNGARLNHSTTWSI